MYVCILQFAAFESTRSIAVGLYPSLPDNPVFLSGCTGCTVVVKFNVYSRLQDGCQLQFISLVISREKQPIRYFDTI